MQVHREHVRMYSSIFFFVGWFSRATTTTTVYDLLSITVLVHTTVVLRISINSTSWYEAGMYMYTVFVLFLILRLIDEIVVVVAVGRMYFLSRTTYSSTIVTHGLNTARCRIFYQRRLGQPRGWIDFFERREWKQNRCSPTDTPPLHYAKQALYR